MSNTYHLRNNDSEISIKVQVGTIGNASSIATKFRSGGSFEEIARSAKTDTGNIPNKKVGISNELIGATIVVRVLIAFENGISKTDLDQAFETLFVRVTLLGGLDGEQFYDIPASEKTMFDEKKMILAAKEIKLSTQTITI